MENRRKIRSLRTLGSVCKPSAQAGQRSALRLCIALLAAACSSCTATHPVRLVTLGALEAAPSFRPAEVTECAVLDVEKLRGLCTPLGPRLGLLQIRSQEDWGRLTSAVSGLGQCPDLTRGTLVGVGCWAGTPLEGECPVRLESVQLSDGGGLLTVHFAGGSFHPDGTGQLETGYVEGLQSVLVVDVNGTPFYPSFGS